LAARGARAAASDADDRVWRFILHYHSAHTSVIYFTFDAPKIMVSSPSRLWEAAMYTALLTAIVTWIFHAGAREELAYAAQDKWLNLFGRNLSTLNVSTACL
jgi:hypothetical protein